MVVYIYYNTVFQDSVDGAVEIRGELEALGKVQVLASMTFPAPRAGEAASFGLTGDFSDITLDLPAGAWPADLLVGPSIAIFEMPAGPRRGATVAGLGVNLGPDGIRFPIPVTITAPVLANFDLGNRVLRVHRYNPQTGKQSADSWTPLPYPQGYTVPHDPRVIKATTTSSLGAFAVLAVPPQTLALLPLQDRVDAELLHDAEFERAERTAIGLQIGPLVLDSGGAVSVSKGAWLLVALALAGPFFPALIV
jgi:hypothetical protein